jgi:cyanophycinase
MKAIFEFAVIILFIFHSPYSYTQISNEKIVTTGPKNGTLIIVGGGQTDSCLKYFIELAGGIDQPIVFVPTADSLRIPAELIFDRINKIKTGVRNVPGEFLVDYGKMIKLGAKNVTVLHTNDRNVANSDSFIKPLKTAKGLWFGGGRQWRLVDAYKGTKTEEMFLSVLERGGVIGGTSAGASIQGSFLVRGDTKTNQVMMGDHQQGFGYIKNIAIDQHFLARNRHFDMYEILKNRPELLGIGIDESTAVIVRGDIFEIMGPGYVAIYDKSFWSREGSELKKLPDNDFIFYFLKKGDKYNLRERKVIK